MKNLRFYLVLFLFSLAGCVSFLDRQPSGKLEPENVVFKLNAGGDRYDFELLKLAELKKSKISFDKHSIRSGEAARSIRNWIEELKQYISVSEKKTEFVFDLVPVSLKRSDLEKLVKVLELLQYSGDDPVSALRKQAEVLAAFNNSLRSPLEKNGKLELVTILFDVVSRLNDLPISSRVKNEITALPDSSFWTDRSSQTVDMSLGPAKASSKNLINLLEDPFNVCDYTSPKKGFGTHLGFKINCSGKELKVKLGEEKAAPFNSRIYHRLGYNVPAIHHTENLNVRYSRKLFTEIESRKDQYVRLAVVGIKVAKFKIRKDSDIQHKVKSAVLKNGQQISGEELFKNLLPECADIKCHLNESLYNKDYEASIDYITFRNIAVVEDSQDFEIGAWGYDELDHANRPEVNALALVGAFTGNIDLRKDNTKLVWTGNGEIKHVISDPGSGIGKGIPFSSFNINNFKWEVVHQYEVTDQSPGGKGPGTRRRLIGINGYKPSANHRAFHKLDISEARWIVRQIASISEDELTEALITSGFSVAEMLLTREKLVSIQKNMVSTLGLGAEFPKLMERAVNKSISYRSDGQEYRVTLGNGRSYVVPEKGYTIENGVLNAPAGIPAPPPEEEEPANE